MIKLTAENFKIGGTLLGFIPVCFLSLFMIGEIVSGDISGFGHLIQILPLIVFLVIAWKRPLVGSFFLIVAGIVMGFLYGASTQQMKMETVLLIEFFFFFMLTFSGICFLVSCKK